MDKIDKALKSLGSTGDCRMTARRRGPTLNKSGSRSPRAVPIRVEILDVGGSIMSDNIFEVIRGRCASGPGCKQASTRLTGDWARSMTASVGSTSAPTRLRTASTTTQTEALKGFGQPLRAARPGKNVPLEFLRDGDRLVVTNGVSQD